MKKSLMLAAKLLLICMVAAAALAYTNSVTAPVIKAREDALAKEAYGAVFKEAETFDELADKTKLNDNITAIIEAKKGGQTAGYVFNVMTPKGYAAPLNFTVGVNLEGKVTGFKVLSHSETAGFGQRVEEPAYTEGVVTNTSLAAPVVASGEGKGENEVPAISGATFTTKALQDGFNKVVEKLAELTGRTVDINAVPEAKGPEASELTDEQLKAALPEADGFEKLSDDTLKNEIVKAVYTAAKGGSPVGHVFQVISPKGFGGEIEFVLGVASDGKVLGFHVIKHGETEGFGAAMAEPDFLKKLTGKPVAGADLAISGATFTTEALTKAFAAVEEALKQLK